MTTSRQSAFFLNANHDAMLSPWETRILDIFALIDAYAQRAVAQDSHASYQHAADAALLRIPGLGPSQGGGDFARYSTIEAAYRGLLERAPFGAPDAQIRFIQSLGLFNDPSADATSPQY